MIVTSNVGIRILSHINLATTAILLVEYIKLDRDKKKKKKTAKNNAEAIMGLLPKVKEFQQNSFMSNLIRFTRCKSKCVD